MGVKSEDCSRVEKSKARMKLFPFFFPPASFSGEGELCDICIDLVTLLEEWITDETTADEIAAFVEQFCSQLGPLASVCEGLIESYLPDLLDQLAEGLPPYQVCSSVLTWR